MTTVPLPPFSARNRSQKHWIDGDFPASARTGLLHLLNEAVNRDYVSGWPVVAKELRRIARAPVRNYDSKSYPNIKEAREDSELYLNNITWQHVYDFCERVYGQLSQDTISWRNDEQVMITKAQSQHFLADEIQRLFEEENLAYEFRDGSVQRRGKAHTVNQINKAERTLTDLKLDVGNTFRKHSGISVIVKDLTTRMR